MQDQPVLRTVTRLNADQLQLLTGLQETMVLQRTTREYVQTPTRITEREIRKRFAQRLAAGQTILPGQIRERQTLEQGLIRPTVMQWKAVVRVLIVRRTTGQ